VAQIEGAEFIGVYSNGDGIARLPGMDRLTFYEVEIDAINNLLDRAEAAERERDVLGKSLERVTNALRGEV
jgi:hypothetical protein